MNPWRPLALLQKKLLFADLETGGERVFIDVGDQIQLRRAVVAPQCIRRAFDWQDDTVVFAAVTGTI